jgi:hypothetical protein
MPWLTYCTVTRSIAVGATRRPCSFSPTRLAQAVAGFKGFVAPLPMSSEFYYSYKTNYLPTRCVGGCATRGSARR